MIEKQKYLTGIAFVHNFIISSTIKKFI